MRNSLRLLVRTCLTILLALPASAALFGPDAYIYLDDMKGLPRDAKVDWRGGEVGRISRLGMEKGRHRVELSIERQYLENMRADVRFTVDETTKVVHLVGGVGDAFPLLQKGSEIPEAPSSAAKAVAAGIRAIDEARDGITGFLRGLRGQAPQEAPAADVEPAASSPEWTEWMRGGIDFYLSGPMEGVAKGAPIFWKGGLIGRVTGVTVQNNSPRVEVRLFPGYRGQLHSDVRFGLAGANPTGIRLIGGNDDAAPLLAKGATVPAETPAEAGERAGGAFRNWLQNGTEAAKELGRAINETQLLRAIEEEIQNQQGGGAPKEKTN